MFVSLITCMKSVRRLFLPLKSGHQVGIVVLAIYKENGTTYELVLRIYIFKGQNFAPKLLKGVSSSVHYT